MLSTYYYLPSYMFDFLIPGPPLGPFMLPDEMVLV